MGMEVEEDGGTVALRWQPEAAAAAAAAAAA